MLIMGMSANVQIVCNQKEKVNTKKKISCMPQSMFKYRMGIRWGWDHFESCYPLYPHQADTSFGDDGSYRSKYTMPA
jgi:hypothetical protein